VFDAYGMRAAFWATGGALLTSAVMVALFVREEFQRPESSAGGWRNPLADLWRLASSRTFAPLLLMLVIVFMGHLVMMPVLPGMAELVAGRAVTATHTSILFMAIGITSAASSVGMGWLAGRVGPKQVFVIGAALAAVTSLGPFFAGSMVALTLTVAAASLFQGGLAGLTGGLIALRTPMRQQGAAFGAAQVSQSLGVAFGPLLGGSVAVAFGLRAVFLVNVGLFAVAALSAVVLLSSTTAAASPEPEPAPLR
jgi:predicted MFS family arabinose efflux permease